MPGGNGNFRFMSSRRTKNRSGYNNGRPLHLQTSGLQPSGNQVGIAYVAIPEDIEREKFVRYCRDNGVVFIKDEYGFSHRDVAISNILMEQVIFPVSPYQNGTGVVYVKHSRGHEVPIIIAVLPNRSTIEVVTKEEISQYIGKIAAGVSTTPGTPVVPGTPATPVTPGSPVPSSKTAIVLTKPATGSIDIHAIGGSGEGKIDIKAITPDDTGQIIAYCRGTITFQSTRDLELISNTAVRNRVIDPATGNNLGLISYESGTGLRIEDERGSQIIMNSGGLAMANGVGRISLNSNDVRMGNFSTGTPLFTAARSEQTIASFESLHQALTDLNESFSQWMATFITTSASAASINPSWASFPLVRSNTQLQAAIAQLLTRLQALDTSANNIKSDSVFID